MSPLNRRQFGQLAAASLTTTILTDFSSKAIAQNKSKNQEIICGVNLPSISNALNREDQTPSVDLNLTEMGTGRLVSQKNIQAQFVDNPLSVRKKYRAFFTGDSNRITKLAALGDGNVVISTVSYTRNGNFNHLIYTVGSVKNPQFKAKKILDLETPNQTVESLLRLPRNQFLCIVGIEGIPPFTFKIIDFITGKVLSSNDLDLPPLPPGNRFANLCQDNQGNIFATEIGLEGFPVLISMNLQEKAIMTGKVKIKRIAPLTFEGIPLSNDVKDLNFSASGQLYALVTNKIGKNVLCTVNVNSGSMSRVREFAAEKFGFSL